jgi:hypothetical protein
MGSPLHTCKFIRLLFPLRAADCLNLLPVPPFYMITAVGKYGRKRYGVRVEKGEIRME